MTDPLATARPSISAGILAGGAGTRMGGQDKGWVEWQGRPLVEWVVDVVRPQAQELLISANRHQARYARLGRVLVDPRPEAYEGPFAGMVQLLGAAQHAWLLCVPCDAPELPTDLADRLWAAVAAQEADIAVGSDADGLHPTICLLRCALAADAAQAFAEGERSPRRWFARHRCVHVPGPAPRNLNTPGSLSAVKCRT